MLHTAIRAGVGRTIIRMLLRRGASTTLTNSRGQNAWHLAVSVGNYDALGMLGTPQRMFQMLPSVDRAGHRLIDLLLNASRWGVHRALRMLVACLQLNGVCPRDYADVDASLRDELCCTCGHRVFYRGTQPPPLGVPTAAVWTKADDLPAKGPC